MKNIIALTLALFATSVFAHSSHEHGDGPSQKSQIGESEASKDKEKASPKKNESQPTVKAPEKKAEERKQ